MTRISRYVLSLLPMGIALAAMPSSAQAQDFAGGFLSLSGGVASDYVFRGRSQNDEDWSIDGKIDYEHNSGLFGGVKAATVDFGGGEDAQIQVYGGHTGDIDTLFYVVSGEYNSYAGGGGGLGYAEFKGTLGIDYGILLLRGGVAWSPDFYASSGDSVYVFSNFDAVLPLGLPVTTSFNGEIGYQAIQHAAAFGAGDYYTWNLGLTFTYDKFDLDLRYHDTTIRAAGPQDAKARFVAGLKVYF